MGSDFSTSTERIIGSNMLTKLNYRDLRALYVFTIVVDCKGVSAAQTILDMAQPAISNHLKYLEDKFGFILCFRGRSGFSLTKEGAEVYTACLQLADHLDLFYQEILQIQKDSRSLSGALNIALIDELPRLLKKQISSTIARFYEEYPLVTLHIEILSPHEIESRILNNRLDIGIGYFSQQLKEILYKKLIDERQQIYCSADHLLATAPKIEVEALLHHHAWVKRGYNLDPGIVPIRPSKLTAMAKQMETTLLFIMAGTHLGYLPVDYATSYVEDGAIVPICEEFSYSVSHHLITKNPHSPLIKIFMKKLLG